MRPRWTITLAAVAMPLLAGCFTYAPPSGAPAPGAEVAVVLTDRGRVALSDKIGLEIDQLRGRLVNASDSAVTVAMRETVSLRGATAPWSDEPITLTRDQFGSMKLKTLSRARSGAVAGAFGAFAAFLVINGGLDLGGRKIETDPSTPPGGPGPSSKVLGPLDIPFWSPF